MARQVQKLGRLENVTPGSLSTDSAILYVTTRSFVGYTTEQLAHNKLLPQLEKLLYTWQQVQGTCPQPYSNDAHATHVELYSYVRQYRSCATFLCFGLEPSVGGVVTVAGLCIFVNFWQCNEAVELGSQRKAGRSSTDPSTQSVGGYRSG